MPVAASLKEGGGTFYILFLLFLFLTGVTQAFAYVEAFITNVIDATKAPRWKAALGVCTLGLILTTAFTSNVGWILFDMTEHYVKNYVVILVGLFQCIAVGWVFEYETTANVSIQHRKALKIMSISYWIPVVVLSFYANFSFEQYRVIGLFLIAFCTCVGLLVSKFYS